MSEPWLKLGRPIEQAAKPSRQQLRLAARTADKDKWREHRVERLAWHRLERMRRIYDGRIDRGEVEHGRL